MAIDASKFTDKDKLIAKFYTLRAGLSVIAEETEKIKTVENEIKDLEYKNDEHNRNVLATYNIEISKLSYGSEISSYESQLNTLENHTASPMYAALPAVAIAVGGLFVTAVVLTMVGDDNMEIVGMSTLLITVLLSIFCSRLCRKKAGERERAALRAQLEQKIEEAKKEDKKRLDRIDEVEKERNQKLDVFLLRINELKEKLNNEIIPNAISVSQAVKKAMLKTGDGIITEADWENIDLLIFYLETGRADSIKEALQLVDRQRQTDQIVFSINEAADYIANTTREAFNRLGEVIISSFGQISDQIQINHNEAMRTMISSFKGLESSIEMGQKETRKEIKNLNETIKKQGEKVADVGHLNAVLLRKANESSDNLVRELKYNQKYWNI